jgi:glycosyltransferase involved in cell wall biosynthesis
MRRFPEARWLGQRPRNETLRWVRAADLLVSASPKEGAPTVIREALALGTKVVALDCGDLKQWAENDRNLVVVAHEGNANTVAQPKALRVQGVNEPPPTAVSADIPETPRPERPATRHFEPYSVKAGLVDAIRECLDQAAPPRLRF